jgi:hypothetical protein
VSARALKLSRGACTSPCSRRTQETEITHWQEGAWRLAGQGRPGRRLRARERSWTRTEHVEREEMPSRRRRQVASPRRVFKSWTRDDGGADDVDLEEGGRRRSAEAEDESAFVAAPGRPGRRPGIPPRVGALLLPCLLASHSWSARLHPHSLYRAFLVACCLFDVSGIETLLVPSWATSSGAVIRACSATFHCPWKQRGKGRGKG